MLRQAESRGRGRSTMNDNSFRDEVKRLIVESSAPDLQSFCYWTLYHAFHLWKHEHDVFGNIQKDDTESEMSAAKCLVELKSQSKVTNLDPDVPALQTRKLTDDSNSANKIKPLSKISKSQKKENAKGAFVRNHGNILFPLNCVMLSSSEHAQESASESPLSVVFPWSPMIWTQGMNGAVEATNLEEIFANEEDQARNRGFFANTSKSLDRQDVQKEHSCAETNASCSEINLEVYLGDVNEVNSEPFFMDNDETVPHLSTKSANASTDGAMKIASGITSMILEENRKKSMQPAILEKDCDEIIKFVNSEEGCQKIQAQCQERENDCIAFSARRNIIERKRHKRKRLCCCST